MAASSRNIAIGLVGAVVFIIVAYLSVTGGFETGDKKLYKDFFDDIVKKTKIIDKSYQPFGDAVDKQQWVDAVKIAKSTLTAISKNLSDLEVSKVPDMKDKAVEKELRDAKAMLDEAYMNKINVISNFLAFAKDPSTLKEKDAEIQKNIAGFKQGYVDGMAKLVLAGQTLGFDADKLVAQTKK
ncbi:MAG: hypothetical protein HGA78_00290 [Nitrospirales bacterium]|nr:hypothetical protein [Nitrospirales bacterium]